MCALHALCRMGALHRPTTQPTSATTCRCPTTQTSSDRSCDETISGSETTMMAQPPLFDRGFSASQLATTLTGQKHHLQQSMLNAPALFFSLSYSSRQYQEQYLKCRRYTPHTTHSCLPAAEQPIACMFMTARFTCCAGMCCRCCCRTASASCNHSSPGHTCSCAT